jgi:mRNA interferase MazF
MAVTSQTRPSGSYGEVVVNEWKDAGLLKPSVIKPIFATIEKEIVIRTIGRIQEKDAMVLREVLGKLLGR